MSYELISGVPTYQLYVGGEWVRSSRNAVTASENPADGALFANVHQAGEVETTAAIDAAHGAFRDWSEMTVAGRTTIFLDAADQLKKKSADIVETLIL